MLTFSTDGYYSLSYLIIYKELINQYSDTLICLENGFYQLTNQKYKYDGGWSGLGKYTEGTIHFTPNNGKRQWSSLVDNDMGHLSDFDNPDFICLSFSFKSKSILGAAKVAVVDIRKNSIIKLDSIGSLHMLKRHY